ncbi:MAG: hypothetical protein ACRDD2_01545 [Sarcina sp.]
MSLLRGKYLKKKIKVKIKTILIVLAVIFVVIPNSIIALSYLIFNSQWRVTSKNIPVTYFTQGLLNLYVKIPKVSPFEDLAYYIMGNNYYNQNQNQNLIVASYGTAGKDIKFYSAENPVEKAIKNYEDAIRGKGSGKYYIKNIFNLIELYWLEGQEDKLWNTIEILKNSKDEEIKNLGVLVEGITYIKNNDYENANKSLDNVAEDYKIPLAVDYYKGTIEILKGNEKAAKEYLFDYFAIDKRKAKQLKYNKNDINYVKIDLSNAGILFSNEDIYGNSEASNNKEKLLERKKEVYLNNNLDEKYKGSLKGTFKINDIPMKGTLILLTESSSGLYENGRSYSYGNDLKSFAYVDEKGEFYFNNIDEGEYLLSLAIPYNLAINSGLNEDLIRNCLVGEKIKIKKTSELKEGEKYNNYFITESEFGLAVYEGLIENGIPKPEIKEEKEESEEPYDEGIATFEIKEKENDIEILQLNGSSYYWNIEGLLAGKKLKKGESIELSKNFLTKDWEYGFVEKVKLTDEGGFFAFSNLGVLVGQDEITLSYDEKEKELIKENNIKGLYQYYEGEIEEGRETINKIERLIKLYVLGYNDAGEGKNITRAKDLNNKLRDIRKNEVIYRQIEAYIRNNQYIIVYQR